MYGTAERAKLVRLRVGELHRQKENWFLGGLVSWCVMLSFFLVRTTGAVTGGGRGYVPGPYGAMLMLGGAVGYVLVGVTSFALAAVITSMCIRGEKRNGKSKKTCIGWGQNGHEE